MSSKVFSRITGFCPGVGRAFVLRPSAQGQEQLYRLSNGFHSIAGRQYSLLNKAITMMAYWKQIVARSTTIIPHPRFFSTKSYPYIVKVGIPEFLNAVGNGVETHVEKLEKEIGDFQKLLLTRTLQLKEIGIPCKHRKLILRHTHKYRLGLWRPRADIYKTIA